MTSINGHSPWAPTTTTFFLAMGYVIGIANIFTVGNSRQWVTRVSATRFYFFQRFFFRPNGLLLGDLQPSMQGFVNARDSVGHRTNTRVITRRFSSFARHFNATDQTLDRFGRRRGTRPHTRSLVKQSWSVRTRATVIEGRGTSTHFNRMTAGGLTNF